MSELLRSFYIFEKKIILKKIAILLLYFLLFSCTKTGKTSDHMIKDSLKVIDSINAERIKYNDSIKILNLKSHFRDLSGTHRLTHSSIENSGKVTLKNIGRDLYEISGGAKSGKSYVKIEGELKMVSEEYMNFTGEITQSIPENDHGKTDIRTKKTTFAKKGNAKYWRLQNMLNQSGFVDHIDIYF